MAVTALSSGTKTAVIGEEFELAEAKEAGTFTLHIDTNAMEAGDVLELRLYQMVLTAGTSRVAYIETYYGKQVADDKIKISVPISNELTDTDALRFTIKQTAGTGRAYPWKVLKYA